MRVEMVFHSYIEMFDRLFSVRFDPKDWMFKITNTKASITLYIGPLHLSYTNHNILHLQLRDLINSVDQDFADYQVKDKSDPYMELEEINPDHIN